MIFNVIALHSQRKNCRDMEKLKVNLEEKLRKTEEIIKE